MNPYDAILIVSFGGPEGPADVMPFLENVLRGKNVPESRKNEVAKHYLSFGGISPINAQNRELKNRLQEEFSKQPKPLPVFLGNRNWKPFIRDALEEMRRAGSRRALAYATSAYSSYSGCRQYLEDIARSQSMVGKGAPEVDKIREFHNHPLFIDLWVKNINAAFLEIPSKERAKASLVFTAHSIPLDMSDSSDYRVQLEDTAELICSALGRKRDELVFQSRSGPPTQRWLEPDILDHLDVMSAKGCKNLVLAPIGFVSDHLEVIYDLDHMAREKAEGLGIRMARAKTPGSDSIFIKMLTELIAERCDSSKKARFLGKLGPGKDVCPSDCCTFNTKNTIKTTNLDP